MNNFLKRVLTGTVLGVSAALAILYLPISLAMVMVSAIIFLGAWEWSLLMGLQKKSTRFLYLILFTLVLSIVVSFHTITNLC